MDATEARNIAKSNRENQLSVYLDSIYSMIKTTAEQGLYSLEIRGGGHINDGYFEEIAAKLFLKDYQVIVEPTSESFSSLIMEVAWRIERGSLSTISDYIDRITVD